MSIASSIALTLPEVILSASAIALMLVAAYAGDKATRFVNGAAVAALIAAFVSLGQQGSAFDGLYSADAFSDFTGRGAHGPWDYAGALLVCQEAGATMADAEGRELIVLDPDVRRAPVAGATAALQRELAGALRAATS